ncbi:NUDIX hydrolase [Hahella aquimaris]|uniref:NUDIX hydrolase n=1 Tax=Hahella sp. HNIBRBA332 TaxID=3015983 RepID=UPI00273AD58D|nr:NUDIX hydrolase [Hahella sp. HNIBRBA332]WLQ15365.1 NUDIX hydrolase [Hahella sp. HNIBRBA332]
MVWRPRAVVAAVIPQDDKFLFVEEEIDGRAVLNQPAGHIERGESIFDAVLRETLEETGWEVELENFVGIYVLNTPDPETVYHRYCFSARPLRQSGRSLDPDITATHWLSPAQLINGDIPLRSDLVRLCLEDYLAGRRLPLDTIRHHKI